MIDQRLPTVADRVVTTLNANEHPSLESARPTARGVATSVVQWNPFATNLSLQGQSDSLQDDGSPQFETLASNGIHTTRMKPLAQSVNANGPDPQRTTG